MNETGKKRRQTGVAGILLILAGLLVTWLNETSAVRRTRFLEETGGTFVEVTPSVIDPANDGRLVLVRGRLESTDTLEDPDTGLEMRGLVLERRVRPCPAWLLHDTDDEDVDETTETPGPDSSGEVNAEDANSGTADGSLAMSGSGQRPTETGESGENDDTTPLPEEMTESAFLKDLGNARWDAREVRLGAFLVPPALVARLAATRPWRITGEVYDAMAPHFGDRSRLAHGVVVVETGSSREESRKLAVSYHVAPVDVAVTILAKQTGSTLAPYRTPDGRIIFEVTRKMIERPGRVAIWHGISIPWWLRGLGLALILGGVRGLYLAGWWRKELELTTRPSFRLALLGAGLFVIAASLPWLVFRPVWGGLLLAFGLLAVGVSVTRPRQSRPMVARS